MHSAPNLKNQELRNRRIQGKFQRKKTVPVMTCSRHGLHGCFKKTQQWDDQGWPEDMVDLFSLKAQGQHRCAPEDEGWSWKPTACIFKEVRLRPYQLCRGAVFHEWRWLRTACPDTLRHHPTSLLQLAESCPDCCYQRNMVTTEDGGRKIQVSLNDLKTPSCL